MRQFADFFRIAVAFHHLTNLLLRALYIHALTEHHAKTAVIENDVSILQSVTLGGTGKSGGDRHPKIREGVMIGAGAKILGNIEVGRGAKIGAGSVVLQPVPPHTTAAGVPARIVGKPDSDKPSMDMDQHFNGINHTFEYGDGI